MFSKRIRIRSLIKGRFWRGGAHIYIYMRYTQTHGNKYRNCNYARRFGQ